MYAQVVWENKGGVGDEKEVPHLVYISREKRPEYVHHYKSGAMNFLVIDFSNTSLFPFFFKFQSTQVMFGMTPLIID